MLRIFGLHAVNLCVIILLSASSDVSEGSVPEPAPVPIVSALDGIPSSPKLDSSHTGIVGIPWDGVNQQLLPSTPRTISSLPISGSVLAVSSLGIPSARNVSAAKPVLVSETSPEIPPRSAPVSLPRSPKGTEPGTTPEITPQGLSPGREQENSASTGVISRSYLLLLAGNATVVRLREKDFAKYLKLNLAARLSLEYDDVRVNQVLVAPSRLVVNVSVVIPKATSTSQSGPGRRPRDGPHGDSPLHMMADTNATLLELSGEEYRIVRLVSLHSDSGVGSELHVQQHLQEEPTYSEGTLMPRSIDTHRHFDSLYLVPALVGAVCLSIVFVISLKLTAKRHYNRFWVLPKMLPKMLPKRMPSTSRRVHRILEAEDHLLPTYLAPPAVIYSGPFADHAASSRLHWLQVEEASSKLLGANLPVDVTTPKHSQLHSPSKLHIFSCRPGAVVIPLRYNHAQSQQSLRGTGFPLG